MNRNAPPWPRRWLVIGFLLCAAALIVLACWPARAEAGWFDFIGTTAQAVGEAAWKLALIKAIERTLPSLILLTCIIGAIGCAWIVGQATLRFGETAREALRDGKVTGAEGVVLIAQGTITVVVMTVLGWFGWFLMVAARSGLSELMR